MQTSSLTMVDAVAVATAARAARKCAVPVRCCTSVLAGEKPFVPAPSGDTAQQQRGRARRIETQADASPFGRVALAGDEVFNGRDGAAGIAAADTAVRGGGGQVRVAWTGTLEAPWGGAATVTMVDYGRSAVARPGGPTTAVPHASRVRPLLPSSSVAARRLVPRNQPVQDGLCVTSLRRKVGSAAAQACGEGGVAGPG